MSLNDIERKLRKQAGRVPKKGFAGKRNQKLEVQLPEGTQTTKQPLRTIKPFAKLVHSIPDLLKPEAQITLQALYDCFSRAGVVKEGLIGDLIWGFEQCGIPRQCTAAGLEALAASGYLKFQAPDNTFIEFSSDQIGKAWVRYEPKLLQNLYDG